MEIVFTQFIPQAGIKIEHKFYGDRDEGGRLGKCLRKENGFFIYAYIVGIGFPEKLPGHPVGIISSNIWGGIL